MSQWELPLWHFVHFCHKYFYYGKTIQHFEQLTLLTISKQRNPWCSDYGWYCTANIEEHGQLHAALFLNDKALGNECHERMKNGCSKYLSLSSVLLETVFQIEIPYSNQMAVDITQSKRF